MQRIEQEYTVIRPDGTHYRTDEGGARIASVLKGYSVLQPAILARQPEAAGAACPECGESEPFTGACGSQSPRALCRQPGVAGAVNVGSVDRLIAQIDQHIRWRTCGVARTPSIAEMREWKAALEAAALREQATPAGATADDLRREGWAVAVHNDYRLHGEQHTFWLFTKDGRAVKGEGRTDAEALGQVQKQVTALAQAAQGDDDWRLGWAFAYSGTDLYRDDGELQDNAMHPFIDWRRDSAQKIRRKIHERAMNRVNTTVSGATPPGDDAAGGGHG